MVLSFTTARSPHCNASCCCAPGPPGTFCLVLAPIALPHSPARPLAAPPELQTSPMSCFPSFPLGSATSRPSSWASPSAAPGPQLPCQSRSGLRHEFPSLVCSPSLLCLVRQKGMPPLPGKHFLPPLAVLSPRGAHSCTSPFVLWI